MNPRLVSPRPLVNRAEAEGISSRGGEDSSNPFPQPDEKILKKKGSGSSIELRQIHQNLSTSLGPPSPLVLFPPSLTLCNRKFVVFFPMLAAFANFRIHSKTLVFLRPFSVWLFDRSLTFWMCFFVNFVSSCFFSSSVSTCWISGWWIGELVVEDLNPSFENLFLAIIVFFFY